MVKIYIILELINVLHLRSESKKWFIKCVFSKRYLKIKIENDNIWIIDIGFQVYLC